MVGCVLVLSNDEDAKDRENLTVILALCFPDPKCCLSYWELDQKCAFSLYYILTVLSDVCNE